MLFSKKGLQACRGREPKRQKCKQTAGKLSCVDTFTFPWQRSKTGALLAITRYSFVSFLFTWEMKGDWYQPQPALGIEELAMYKNISRRSCLSEVLQITEIFPSCFGPQQFLPVTHGRKLFHFCQSLSSITARRCF